MPRIRPRRAMLEEKLAYWIGHRTNVLFRCGPGVSVAVNVTAAFGKAGLQWRALSANGGEFEQALNNKSVEAVWAG